jgi:hypothetical protein
VQTLKVVYLYFKNLNKNYLIFTLFFFSTFFLYLISYLNIGNKIFGFMIEGGRFDDYFNLFLYAKSLPDPNSPLQWTSFSIFLGRIFKEYIIVATFLVIIFGILFPIFLIKKKIQLLFNEKPYLFIFFIITSHPFLFAFFRGNPVLIASILSITGTLFYINGCKYKSAIILIIAPLFHPSAIFFLLIFLETNITIFLLILIITIFLTAFFYLILGDSIYLTLTNEIKSLAVYKKIYVYGGGGDLYNNSFLIIFKIFQLNIKNLKFLLRFFSFSLFLIILLKIYSYYKFCNKNFNYTIFYIVLYIVPISINSLRSVSADYHLSYFLAPILLMTLVKFYKWPLYIIFLICLPKHFVFFSSYWKNLHPEYKFVYNDIILNSIGCTLNSIVNPFLILLLLFVSNKDINVYIRNLSKIILIKSEIYKKKI